MEQVRSLLAGRVGTVVDRPGGTRWYESAQTFGQFGSLMAWGNRSGSAEVFVEVHQTDCDVFGFEWTRQLMRKLSEWDTRCTRIDPYVDDYARTVAPAVVLDAFEAGQAVTRMEKAELHRTVRGGTTATFGARGSEAFLRVYEKGEDSYVSLVAPEDGDAERSEGATAAASGRFGVRDRWELEAKGRLAGELWAGIVAGLAPDRLLWSYLSGVLDFRARVPGQAHGERAPRLWWWAALVEAVQRARVAPRRLVDSLARRMTWLEHQVARVYATVAAGYGPGLGPWLEEIGRQRMTALDWAMVPAVAA